MTKKTVSAKQIEANKRNAKKSTGPRTRSGKSKSSRNAETHGILSRHVVVDDIEDPDEWRGLLEGFREELCPEGSLEDIMVQRLAGLYWRVARIQRFEQGAIREQIDAARSSQQVDSVIAEIEGTSMYRSSDVSKLEAEYDRILDRLQAEERTLKKLKSRSSLIESGFGWKLDAVWYELADSEGAKDAEVLTDELRRRFLDERGISLASAEKRLRAAQRGRIKMYTEALDQIEAALEASLKEEKRKERNQRLMASFPCDFNMRRITRYESQVVREIHRVTIQLRTQQDRRREWQLRLVGGTEATAGAASKTAS